MTQRFEADPNTLNDSQQYQVTNWLAEQEEMHDIVLYEAEYEPTAWTQRCIRQADCILLVGLAAEEPRYLQGAHSRVDLDFSAESFFFFFFPSENCSVSPVEMLLETTKTRAQKELVLLHHADDPAPSRTSEWLNLRTWCSMHHHVRCSGASPLIKIIIIKKRKRW